MYNRAMRHAMWLLAVTLGCGRGSGQGSGEGAGQASVKPAADCRTRAHELAAFLTSVDQGTPPVYVGTLHLVHRDDVSARPQLAPVLRLDHGHVTLDAVDVELGALAEKLKVAHPGVVNLAADEATPASIVVIAAQQLHAAGVPHVALIFERPAGKDLRPPRSSVDDQLDAAMKAEPSDRATKVAELMTTTIKSCPALQRAFGAVAGDAGEDKAKVLIAAIEPSLVDCDCAPDLGAMRSIMYDVLHDEHPTAAVTLTLDKAAPVTTLPDALPWSEASKRFTNDATLWLEHAR